MTHNNEIALMRDNRLAVLGLRGATTVYDLDANATMHRIAAPDASARGLVEDAIAYFQSADDLYRHGEYRFHSVPQTVATLGDHHAATR
jgi:hypothetical protein